MVVRGSSPGRIDMNFFVLGRGGRDSGSQQGGCALMRTPSNTHPLSKMFWPPETDNQLVLDGITPTWLACCVTRIRAPVTVSNFFCTRRSLHATLFFSSKKSHDVSFFGLLIRPIRPIKYINFDTLLFLPVLVNPRTATVTLLSTIISFLSPLPSPCSLSSMP